MQCDVELLGLTWEHLLVCQISDNLESFEWGLLPSLVIFISIIIQS